MSQLFPGTPVSISCTFSGVPNPTLSWLMDGNILTKGVDGISIADTFNTSDLTVIDSGGEKGGSYICIANNTAGSSYNEFVIQCKHIYAFLFSEMYTDCGSFILIIASLVLIGHLVYILILKKKSMELVKSVLFLLSLSKHRQAYAITF